MPLIKHHVFRFYGWYALVFALLGLAGYLKDLLDPGLALSFLGGVFSFIFFVQKQKLAETSLFRELFDGFNKRYNDMNGALNDINVGDKDLPLSSGEIVALYDYFNLCAEEYLYYRMGYIPPVVWESWYNGMLIYYSNQRIRDLWDKELRTNSYYGFTISLPPGKKCP